MENDINLLTFILAMIVFTFQRADTANRADYVEEDSVF